ncbi:MAG: lipoprotein [Bacteroidetes bacterium]|nr:lipoprotein [Bacteroidota bacterium]
MKRYLLFISTTLLLSSCSNISDNNSNDLIARAGQNFLYQNQMPSFSSEQDSMLRYLNYIETWAKEKILYDLSLTNLSQSKKNDLDILVEKYKVDLYINSYKDLIVNSIIDSIVTDEEIESFYNRNIENFKLNENLLKYRYLKVPSDNININRIRRYIQRLNQSDRVFLDSLNFQFADLKLNDSMWFTEREVISSIEFINQKNKSNYMEINRLYELENDQYINYFIIKDLLKSGNIPPLSYLYDRIKSNIINQRKLNLLQNINKEILNDALKSNKYEVFK